MRSDHSRQKSVSHLAISLPAVKTRYSSAVSPNLTPITASSTYSPIPGRDPTTPFNAHDSFELELKFAEDRGDYIFSIESPYQVSRRSSDELRLDWQEDSFQASTPGTLFSGDFDDQSMSSCSSFEPPTAPSTPENRIRLPSDSPTMPSFRSSPALSQEVSPLCERSKVPRYLPSMDVGNAGLPARPDELLRRSPPSSSLLSPITIVLDTIQEHSISSSPRRRPRAAVKGSMTRNKALPSVDLFGTVFNEKPLPPMRRPPSGLNHRTLPSLPLPPPPAAPSPSLPTRSGRLASPTSAWVEDGQASPKQKTWGGHVQQAQAQASFGFLPFDFDRPPPPPPAVATVKKLARHRMYEMI